MTNNLKYEKSPYLLQHAHNPVNWYAWGEAAFVAAKNEDKPIFLSIGYSTCHWCHVMAEESFEDEEIAEILNKHFICIKVDREERQDIDSVYMSVCQAMTGGGGWPLTIFMTPEKKPFFSGTYFPKKARYGRPGLKELLEKTALLWRSERHLLIKAGDDTVTFIQHKPTNMTTKSFNQLIQEGFEGLSRLWDRRYGGFGLSPKFPTPHNLMFLMDYSLLYKNERALEMTEKTLDCMFRGGIFDHIGGGFSRYSTDERWLIPHFEKTLYDNALLAYAYLEAYRITNEPLYKRVAEKTLNYILEELTHDDGGFYCGQDADSDGVEGKYYLLTPEDIREVSKKQDSEDFCKWFDITDKGNFEGMSIPNLLNNPKYTEENITIEAICRKLKRFRKDRVHLNKDDKILTSWNAMTIIAFAKASFVLKETSYSSPALAALKFIERRLTDSDGKLFVRYRDDEAAFLGLVDDYAFYALALLELYKSSFEAEYLVKAVGVARQMISLFFDKRDGGFYLYSKDSERLISRPKETYDAAIPSGNSVSSMVLVSLAALTGEIEWIKLRDKQLEFLSCQASLQPEVHCFALSVIMRALKEPALLICASTEKNAPEELISFLRGVEQIDLYVLYLSPDNRNLLFDIVPSVKNYPLSSSDTVYYLCQNGVCSSPTEQISVIRDKLKNA